MKKRVLIIGGVAGGASCAARLRRMDEEAEIIIFERGEYISFANCGLPYYIGGVIKDREELILWEPEDMKSRFNIEVRIFNEVVSINKEEKTIEVKEVKTGKTYKENYDKLVLSPGSAPLKPPIPGIELDGIYTLWNIPDTDRIKKVVTEKKPKKAVVIGGGFIGIEMAENLKDIGIDVTIVEMINQVMAPVDFEIAQFIHEHLEKKGVNLVLNDGVKNFEKSDIGVKVVTQSGKEIEAEMVMLAIGVRPNSELAKDAGLAVNQRGGIITNELLEAYEDIYAVGDAIEVTDFITGDKTMIPLAGPANKQGRIAANNISGMKEKYNGTEGSSVLKVFDLTVAATGINEKTLIRNGQKVNVDYFCIQLHAGNHAGYYPGVETLHLKVIFESKTGKVLGAQSVGVDGVDKRIDVIATAIRFGATAYDLKELELCYAPPYSSAKDPVNMAGFVACNILDGDQKIVQYSDIEDMDISTHTFLDVRTQEEWDSGHIPDATHIPVDILRDKIIELDKSKTIIVYCAVGVRAWTATRILMQNGFQVLNMTGGYTTYKTAYYNDLNRIEK
ncbi:MAG: FAD-dependent oxidoreductase [Clostridiales bacterium]|nr:FAD-dependent oxidoreductase [Clostridiales bacterium]